MYNIPTILSSDELMDKAYHKASKITENPKIRNKVTRRKKVVIAKLDAITDILDSVLGKYVSTFPSFDQLHNFEFELINILIGVDKIRKSLGAIDWGRKQVRNIRSELTTKLKRIRIMNDYSKLEELRQMFYGRVTSILKQISSDLEFLNTTRNQLKKLPFIDPNLPTIVVAGFPNVGKSLVVKQLSSAKPTIARYPFTTKQLNLGHILIDHQKVQIIDTPGLLDRQLSERNKIELQAIMALEYLADLIIFILDPSEHCGYQIEEQQRLFDDVKKVFGNIKLIPIENKSDLIRSNSEFLKISALESQGLDELMDIIRNYIAAEET
jgi:nucleolar GTP-binding protein